MMVPIVMVVMLAIVMVVMLATVMLEHGWVLSDLPSSLSVGRCLLSVCLYKYTVLTAVRVYTVQVPYEYTESLQYKGTRVFLLYSVLVLGSTVRTCIVYRPRPIANNQSLSAHLNHLNHTSVTVATEY